MLFPLLWENVHLYAVFLQSSRSNLYSRKISSNLTTDIHMLHYHMQVVHMVGNTNASVLS